MYASNVTYLLASYIHARIQSVCNRSRIRVAVVAGWGAHSIIGCYADQDSHDLTGPFLKSVPGGMTLDACAAFCRGEVFVDDDNLCIYFISHKTLEIQVSTVNNNSIKDYVRIRSKAMTSSMNI